MLITWTIALSSVSSVTYFKFNHEIWRRLKPLTERAVWVGPRLQP